MNLNPFNRQQLPAPVACWRFKPDLDRMATLQDPSGEEPQGMMIRGVAYEDGRSGYAGVFDGTTSAVEIADRPAFHLFIPVF